MTFEIEAAEIERLVDGRLEVEEQMLLLDWADDHPSNWRTIAMAFVERQTLKRALSTDGTAVGAGVGRATRTLRLQSVALVACSALLALSLAGHVWSWSRDNGGAAIVVSDPTAPKSVEPNETVPKSEPTYVFFVPDENVPPQDRFVSRTRTTSSALEEAAALLTTPLLNEESRRLFQEVGFEPVEHPSLFLVEGEDGRGYVVPQRRVTLRPVSHQP